MRRRHPAPLPRLPLVVGVLGTALVAAVGSPSTGLGPSLDARADAATLPASGLTHAATRTQAQTPTPAPSPSPAPTTSPRPTATPEPRSAKTARVQRKAQRLAASLAEDLAGFSRADVRRGVPITFSLGTGRALVRLQVRHDDRWTNVARLQLPKGKGKRILEPGREGRRRLAAATVEDNRVQARYAVALSDGSVDATAWKSFRLNR